MNSKNELIIPYSWAERRPVLLDRFFYIPPQYPYVKEIFPFINGVKPIVIEYCSGNGEWIGERAKQNPHLHWMGVEKKFQRARQIWDRVQRESISNLTVVCGEALNFTRFYAPQAEEIYVNFPDPWPKLRHAKHRLVRKEFLEELLSIVPKGGKATCVTDELGYAKEMTLEFAKCPQWRSIYQGTEWPGFGRSFFKDLWLQKGRTIHYLSYEKQ